MSLQFVNEYAKRFKEVLTEQPVAADLGDAEVVLFNESLWQQLGGDEQPDELALWMNGQQQWPGTQPLAQKYAGHQFGHFNPYLGDGRGLLLGEIKAPNGTHWDLHIKGAGPTPYGRGGDGRAVLRSSIREYLGSEALAALGIPTTRALALAQSATQVQREQLEPGAQLLRVAATHVRFGHFEHCYYRQLADTQRQLWQYVIEQQWPALAQASVAEQFRQVMQATAEMIACWQAYGFIHGVMNTDNMSLVGETFDYGPYAMLDHYLPEKIFNHTDQGGRYSFLQQPGVGLWNLRRLMQALSLNFDAKALEPILEEYEGYIQSFYFQLMQQRLGLTAVDGETASQLIAGWLQLLEHREWDYNRSLVQLECVFTEPDHPHNAEFKALAGEWFSHYQHAVNETPDISAMQAANPVVTLRTHLLNEVVSSAEQGDRQPLETYLALLKSPFDRSHIGVSWAQPPTASQVSGQLSCSS